MSIPFGSYHFMDDDSDDFPPPEAASEEGILAFGSNLRPATILKAYRHGAFPWFNEADPITWHHPDPRMVLFPQKIKLSKSMRNVLNQNRFRFTVNKDFAGVIHQCRVAKRDGLPGTWISDTIEAVYTSLHRTGFAHSAEAWYQNELVGGLYGVLIGKVFFGESMFAHQANASKFAFIKMVELLQQNGIELIDCQVYTPHLESLGAELISRNEFVRLLQKLVP